jgi:hypothetical protein
MPYYKKMRLNTWLLGLTPPPGAFAHIPNNGNPLFVMDIRILIGPDLQSGSMEKANLPENVSFVISPDSFDEEKRIMWATIDNVAPEFAPIGDNEEERQKQEKFFRELEGKQIWILIR